MIQLKRMALAAAAAASGLAFVPAHAVVSATDPAGHVLLPGAFGGVFDSTAKLLFSNSGGNWVCSGTLLAGGRYVATAAHCADDFTTMTVDFKLGSVVRNVTAAYVHAGWDGSNLSNGSDIAIVKLDSKVTGIQGMYISTGNDIGKTVTQAGYGLVGTGLTGGTGFDRDPIGTDPRLWRPHWGVNTNDATNYDLETALFGSGDNQYGEIYVQDFDDGSAQRNAMQRLKDGFGGTWADSSLGVGYDESLIAGGDSGGGDFVWDGSKWLLSGVHSWGWNVCGQVWSDCDAKPGINSSFGDITGATAVFSHRDFITGIAGVGVVPEPQTYALMALGLAAVGAVARRRRA